MEKLNPLRDWMFRKVHSNNLVYNTCWEDPRCDRELLELNNSSEVVMITSAGCNALDYLLDQPAQINCVDVNPRQNALLQLKLATFHKGSFEDLFQLFGKGAHPEATALYREQLREALPEYAQDYWDGRLNFFSGKGVRKSFYHYSTSGSFAWVANQYIRARRSLHRQIQQLFEADTLDRQSSIYFQIEQKVLNGLVEWMVNRHLTMCLVGVPRSQQELFITKYEKGALGFIQECLRKVFTQQPIQENYFWRLYMNGSYTDTCCPSYLRPDNFEPIRSQSDKIQTHTTTISNFLRENPRPYSHYVLLDHQDWLAANNRPALEEEWQLILENSRPGTRILLRSAAEEVDFFPEFVMEAVEFEKEKTAKTHQRDRVGTYGSVYLGMVR
ncbi:MAG: BtaA family protein [Phaeodactylibacter sp.]|nr:BtaA family protein [Phaeodactylibacter sp.]MCB9300810.1 BtaA family protein [Lewinellaceae bacterium]